MSDTNIRKLYSLYFCDWLLDAGDENFLSLGQAFEERISEILNFKVLAETEVREMSGESIARLVGNSSETMDEAAQAANLENDRKFRELSKVAPAEIKNSGSQDFALWALGLRPRVFADYEYWAKFERFSIDELVWLSTGIHPQSAASEKDLLKASRTHVFPLAEVERRRKLFNRAFPNVRRGHLRAVEFHEWAKSVGFVAHASFHEMLETIAARMMKNTDGHTSKEPSKDSGLLMQPREFNSAARIITAIAMDVYGHVPNQKRSPTTKDILHACHLAGLAVSKDTILKFLRAGEAQIDDET